ncbi:MAG: hypothetical protein JHC73_03175 [Dolichospermum sp.]|nr:hypothetical protein [Dolichospermum sp.]
MIWVRSHRVRSQELGVRSQESGVRRNKKRREEERKDGKTGERRMNNEE